MTRCVFYAIKDHLSHLGIETLHDDWLIYEGARLMAGNRGDTSICIVPFIVLKIAQRHGLDCKIKLSQPFNINWLRSQAVGNEDLILTLPIANLFSYKENSNVGIYFPKFTMHAQFLLKVPKEDYIMRVLFKENSND